MASPRNGGLSPLAAARAGGGGDDRFLLGERKIYQEWEKPYRRHRYLVGGFRSDHRWYGSERRERHGQYQGAEENRLRKMLVSDKGGAADRLHSNAMNEQKMITATTAYRMRMGALVEKDVLEHHYNRVVAVQHAAAMRGGSSSLKVESSREILTSRNARLNQETGQFRAKLRGRGLRTEPQEQCSPEHEEGGEES
eukprot:GHVU01219999.1.p1 GENE.GHVU01219999.1~~GHVU01219999.1.p1  ORF type:complete len:196 (+),score=23.88 GHVU01219999.1:491-1078(+)